MSALGDYISFSNINEIESNTPSQECAIAPKAMGIMIEISSFRLVNISHSWFESSISEMPGLEVHAIS